jgi:hypothetical protein
MIQPAQEVLQTIGLPALIEGNSVFAPSPARQLAAYKNKVSLFYLETLAKTGLVSQDDAELCRLRDKQRRVTELACSLATTCAAKGINYVFIKTLRPFPYAGADVDVLFATRQDFLKTIDALKSHGFFLIDQDLTTATMTKKNLKVNADLQLDMSVSSLPYINKHVLFEHLSDKRISGQPVKVLDASAEANVIACHAFYKEHMFTLSDFYSIVLSCTEINCDEMLEIMEHAGSKSAVQYSFSWTQTVAKATFGKSLLGIERVLDALEPHKRHEQFASGYLAFPYKLPRSLIAKSIVEKIVKDKYSRDSFPRALYSSFSPKHFQALIHHFSRESY